MRNNDLNWEIFELYFSGLWLPWMEKMESGVTQMVRIIGKLKMTNVLVHFSKSKNKFPCQVKLYSLGLYKMGNPRSCKIFALPELFILTFFSQYESTFVKKTCIEFHGRFLGAGTETTLRISPDGLLSLTRKSSRDNVILNTNSPSHG